MRDDDIDDTVVRRSRADAGPGGPGAADALSDTAVPLIPPMPGRVSAAPVTSDDHQGPLGDTVIRPERAVPTVGDDDPFGATVVRPAAGGSGPGTAAVDHVGVGGIDELSADTEDPEATIVRHRAGRSGSAVVPGATQRDGDDRQLPSLPSSGTTPVRRVPSVRVAGRVVRLDQPVVIGRRPGLPRVLRGPEPMLVTVPSPRGQVSSSHVLVHAEGEVAVVEDLRSTNGTVIRPAGAAPFRMRSGASNVVLTGTVVEIGDGNVIEVLSPHLRVAPAADDLDPFPDPPPGPPPTGTPRHPRERP